jgi:hypothetical protein
LSEILEPGGIALGDSRQRRLGFDPGDSSRQFQQRRGRHLQGAIAALESDVTNTARGYHETTAILDKIAAGELLGRRQDMAANQMLSHVLEQLLARGKRQRDSEAASMNMRLGGMRDGRAASNSIVRGAAHDLRAWRQP